MPDTNTAAEEVPDDRLEGLLDNLAHREGGAFCNNAIFVDEIRSLILEVQRSRARPLHCPGCDGDHL